KESSLGSVRAAWDPLSPQSCDEARRHERPHASRVAIRSSRPGKRDSLWFLPASGFEEEQPMSRRVILAFAAASLLAGVVTLGAKESYSPPRTPWGDPQLAGVYSNDDETGVPFERPAQFEGRRLEDVTPQELAALNRQRNEQFNAGV